MMETSCIRAANLVRNYDDDHVGVAREMWEYKRGSRVRRMQTGKYSHVIYGLQIRSYYISPANGRPVLSAAKKSSVVIEYRRPGPRGKHADDPFSNTMTRLPFHGLSVHYQYRYA